MIKSSTITEKISECLNKRYTYLMVMLIGLFGWIFELTAISIILLGLYCLGVFIFCDDPKATLLVLFSVPFFINGFRDTSHYVYFGIGILLFLIGLVFFLIKQIKFKHHELTKGRMFWGFMLFILASGLGGVIYHFNPVTSILVTLVAMTSYIVYFLSINFMHDLKHFLYHSFILIALFVFVEFIILHIRTGNFFQSIISKELNWVGGRDINTCATAILLGMLSMFALGYENKRHDYLYCLGALVFFFMVFITYGRIATLAGAIFAIVGIIVIFIKSDNKKIIALSLGSVLAITAILCVIFIGTTRELIDRYIYMGFSGNGRQVLWPWCLDRFLREPIFGIGFVTYGDPVPTISSDNVVLAHNTILQYITSTGIIGTLLVAVFFVQKYKIVINKFKDFDIFIFLFVLCLELIGMVDQSITMDIFMILTVNSFIVISEQHTATNKIYGTQHPQEICQNR